MTTGFGGSADTRTNEVKRLQNSLISFLNCGILPVPEKTRSNSQASSSSPSAVLRTKAIQEEDSMAANTMSESWVRATLLIRCNSLATGHSGIRPALMVGLVELLQSNITPAIPLRGSISASGDLIPLSYIAGTLQGNHNLQAWIRKDGGSPRQLIPADKALQQSKIAPLQLGPKEGLSMVNGTAVSAGVGVLALHDAHCLAVLAQVLTAMGVEGLKGSIESFDPFLAAAAATTRKGQAEFSHNVRSFLKGTKLASHNRDELAGRKSLRQDRYSIRTSPQWVGPQLENLMLAHTQVTVECNSTTDNPVMNLVERKIVHGGNFQAMSITSAMESVRAVTQILGRMLFSQCTELIMPALNNGLPPNLDLNEPSRSFLMKGVDISTAALQSELAFLANPVASHVQTAEMGNQGLNSLALVSARYTHTALDLLSQLAAAYLFALCQALDLRVLQIRFLENLEPSFETCTLDLLGPFVKNPDVLFKSLWLRFEQELGRNLILDSQDRFCVTIENLQPTVLSFARSSDSGDHRESLLPALRQWAQQCSKFSLEVFRETCDEYCAHPDPTYFLGAASKSVYQFVRGHLQVPFQPVQYKTSKPTDPDASSSEGQFDNEHVPAIGSYISTIYSSIRDGSLYVPVMECLREAGHEGLQCKL